MTIVLYNCSDKRNRIDKTLENGTTVNGTMKNALDVDNISVNIQYDATAFNFNYCYVQELKRYYFIGTPIILPNGVLTLPLQCDVLTTFADTIKGITGTINKKDNANRYNSGYDTIHDVRPNTEKFNFEDNFNHDGNITMVVIRGV